MSYSDRGKPLASTTSPAFWGFLAAACFVIGFGGDYGFVQSLDYNAANLDPSCTQDCFPNFSYTKTGFFGLVVALIFMPAAWFLAGIFNIRAVKHADWVPAQRAMLFLVEAVCAFAIAGVALDKYVPFADLKKGYAYKYPSCKAMHTQNATTGEPVLGYYASTWWCIVNSVHCDPSADSLTCQQANQSGVPEQYNPFLITHALLVAGVSFGFGIWSLLLVFYSLVGTSLGPDAVHVEEREETAIEMASSSNPTASQKECEAARNQNLSGALPGLSHEMVSSGDLRGASGGAGGEDEAKEGDAGMSESLLGGAAGSGAGPSSASGPERSRRTRTNQLHRTAGSHKRIRELAGAGRDGASPSGDGCLDCALISAVFLLLFPFLMACSALLPNSFYRFTPPQIAHYIELSTWEAKYPGGQESPSGATSNPPGAKVLDGAGGYEYLVYPDVLAYYVFLYVVCVFALLVRLFPALARALHWRTPVPTLRWGWSRGAVSCPDEGVKLHWHATLSGGEMLLLGAFGALCVWWLDYWNRVHVYPFQGPGAYFSGKERFARTLGQFSNLLLALVFLPAARNSLWERVFGVPFERALRFHRLLGRMFLVVATLHQLCFWGAFNGGPMCSMTQECVREQGASPLCSPVVSLGCEQAYCSSQCFPKKKGSPDDCALRCAGCTKRGQSYGYETDCYVPACGALKSTLSVDTTNSAAVAAARAAGKSVVAQFVKVGGNKVPTACDFPRVMSQIIDRPYHPDNFTIPLMLILWIFAMAAALLTLDFVRRKHYEVFYFAHHSLFTTFVLGSLMHAHSLWYLLIGSLLLWVADRALRARNACVYMRVLRLAPHRSGVTELVLAKPRNAAALDYRMGQYAWINLPAISTLEWHPFSISSAPSDRLVTFHIKDMGADTFTGKLHALAQTMQSSARGGGDFGRTAGGSGTSDTDDRVATLPVSSSLSLSVSADGGYGRPFDPAQYAEVLLAGGGIGITPCHSVFRELHAQARRGGSSGATFCGAELHWVSQ
eukprot:g986.t1